jgi:predicted GNAT family N-acyltransferase
MYIRKLCPSFMRAVQVLVLSDFASEPDVWENIDMQNSYIMVQANPPKLLGCLLIDKQMYLSYLVVKDDYRGRHIGSRLMQKSTAVRLTCDESLASFYTRYGYSVQSKGADGRIEMVKL